MSFSDLNRDELLELVEDRGFSEDDIEGTGANGYVKNSDIVEFLEDLESTVGTATFESSAEVVESPFEDGTEEEEELNSEDDEGPPEPVRGVRV